jgi:hypothetical protein
MSAQSSAASASRTSGEGAGFASSVFFLPPANRSTTTNSAGMKKIPRSVAASIPETTAVPSIRRAAAPAPVATHSGMHPKMNANDVMRIGRNRSLAPPSAASTTDLPA